MSMNTDKKILGVWHRPNSSGRETNLEELCRLLDEFCEAGVNTVFLESYFHGMAVFKNDLVGYRAKLSSFDYGEYPDYLTAFVEEADKRGIGVHAWVQDFYVGYKDEIPIVKAHPEWMLIDQSGEVRHQTEGQGFGGYLFLDPANKEVRDFLVSLYSEMIKKAPKLKGLNLDYIRYPISIFEEDTDTGYTDVTMRDFAEKCGLSLSEDNMREDLNRQIRENGLADRWTAHRAEYITSFVKQVCDMLCSEYPGKLISTAVFPEIQQTYQKKKQNIKAWLDAGYIDIVTPMVYFSEATDVYNAVKGLKDICGGTLCYTGLYTTYHKQTVPELQSHIEASERAGADGLVLFDSAKTFFENEVDYMSFLSVNYGESNKNK